MSIVGSLFGYSVPGAVWHLEHLQGTCRALAVTAASVYAQQACRPRVPAPLLEHVVEGP